MGTMILSVLTVVAIFTGPIIAIRIQKAIERAGEKRKTKLDIYRTLMATRGMSMHIEHVRALNLIDLAFEKEIPEEKKVLDAWKIYMEHLYGCPQPETEGFNEKLDRWTERKSDLFIDLMHAMSSALGFSFDKVLIKRQSYTPQGYIDEQDYKQIIQSQILKLFMGETSIPVDIIKLPVTPATQAEEQAAVSAEEKPAQ